jgi:hypothetical protein
MPIQFNSSLSSTGPFTAPSFTGSLFGTASHVKVSGSGITVNWDRDTLQLTSSASPVQNASQVFISQSSPGLQPSGALWWNTDDGNLYVQTEGPSGSSFVAATNTIVGAAGNAVSASYAATSGNTISASYSETSSFAITASYSIFNFITSSVTSSVSASYAETASYFLTSSVTSASLAQYATTAMTVNGATGQLLSFDNRTISPSEISASYLQFGFTSWANNNTSPWADYLHLRSWADSSGDNDNLVLFKKNGIGVRVYQAPFGTGSAYSTFKDLAFTDATNASGNWPTASLALTASYFNGTFGTSPTIVHAQNTSGQTIANNQSPTTIVTNWTNILAQNASEWNPATGIFTAAKAGVYSVSAALTYAPKTSAAFGNQVNVVIGKNRGYQAVAANFSETGNAIRRGTVSVTACISLAVGETITIETYHDLGGAASLDTQGWLNTVTIQEISSRITN